MKKIIAVLVSISILIASEAPVAAQALIPAIGKTGRVATAHASQLTARSMQQTSNLVLKSSANVASQTLKAPSIVVPSTRYNVQPPLLPTEQVAQIQTTLTQSVKKSMGIDQLSFAQILYRANNGQTAFLPQAVLNLTNQAQRNQLLRSAFVTAAAAGEASKEQLDIARRFWRVDLTQKIASFNELSPVSHPNPDDLLPALQVMQDATALALLGTKEDLAVLERLFQISQRSPFGPATATLLVRGLVGRGEWTEVEKFFVQNDGKFATLQNGIAAYAQEQGLPVQVATTAQAGQKLTTETANLFKGWGPVLLSATDPSLPATKQWMEWVQNQKELPAVKAINTSASQAAKAVVPALSSDLNDLLPDITSTSAQVRAAALPSGAATTPKEQASVAAVAPAITTTPASSALATQPKALWKWFGRNNGGNNTSPAIIGTNGAVLPSANSPLARFQRASLYAASFVMGLEVATPVIANFGTSFGLSLQDNILVAAATYAPYSLGALISNWIKKFLGRRGSMHLGLAMMGTGFLGGVTWAGLDGAFLPEADVMTQFYKALACITLASTGGVFVHNSIGPIMTELNVNTSDLIRQRRSALTELSRALGMAASFAFPFIATKLLGMDWSFTFALPIPLVVASLLGTSLIPLPNTRPDIHHAAQVVTQKSAGLLQRIKNNEYVRLFKEEKGAGSLLAGLAIMNAVEMGLNNGFLFMLPSLTKDPSSQYLFGMAQFAAPFILGRYLAKRFLTWFPKRNLSVATGIAAAGAASALLPGVVDNVYALTTSLFLAETGISSLFTLSFARTAKNPSTVDRLTTLIVFSALTCAIGPMIFSGITQFLMDTGMSNLSATAAAMIGIPAGLTVLASRLFRRVELGGKETPSSLNKLKNFIKNSLYHPKQRRKRT